MKFSTIILLNIFSQFQTAPEKDIDVFIAKATLKNSQKLILQTSWNWEFLHDVIEGTKDRIPAMTDAVYKFINKYHTTHFGFDLNRGSLKLKNTVSSVIERAYHEVPMSFNTLQNSIRQLIDQGKDMYMKASDSLMSMRLQNVIDQLGRKIGQVLEWTEDKIYALLNAVRQLLRDTKFTVPGSEEELSSLEMFQIARRSVSRDTDRAIQRFTSVIEKISRYIREIEFTIPGTDVVVNGNKIIDNVNSLTSYAYEQLKIVVRKGTRFVRKTVDDLIQVIGEKGENFLTYLQEENMEIASQIDAIHAEVLKSSKQHIDEAKKILAEYKDLAKLQIEEAYNLNMTRVNLDTVELINIFQSHLYGGLNEAVDLMRRNSQSTAPYFKATNKKIDIEIPLPFLWKSFSEWPKPSRH